MDHNNNNHPTSSGLFDYDPISPDDELMQLINSVIPQNHDVSDVLTTLIENQGHDNQMMTFSNSFHASTAHQLPQHNNVVEFNFTSAPALAAAPAPAPSKDEAREKKSKAVEIERKRRQDMASLYQELRSLLPPGLVKRKRRSISDLLQEATNHITNTEVGIKGLNHKKDELLRMRSSTAGSLLRPSSSSTNSYNTSSKEQQNHHHVTVKPCKDGLIEVIVSANASSEDDHHENNNRGFCLSKMLQLLGEEGLNVINCVSARIDTKLVHTIQAQVDDGRCIDLCLLQQTLTDHS